MTTNVTGMDIPKKSISEHFFGGDLWILRTILRRVFNLLTSLILIKKLRKQTRKFADGIIEKLEKKKINFFVSKYPDTYSVEQTVKKLASGNYSLARYGDGEFNIAIGRHIGFQEKNPVLAKKLTDILNSTNPNLLVGIASWRIEKYQTSIIKKFVIRRGYRTLRLLNLEKKYDSAMISFFPQDPRDFEEYTTLLKRVWAGKNVLFVIGENSRFFIEEELFDNIASHNIVYGPSKHAFRDYSRIYAEITTKYGNDWLVLIALGPTSSVLASDLADSGYQAIDFGHTPNRYRKSKFGQPYPEDHQLYIEGRTRY